MFSFGCHAEEVHLASAAPGSMRSRGRAFVSRTELVSQALSALPCAWRHRVESDPILKESEWEKIDIHIERQSPLSSIRTNN